MYNEDKIGERILALEANCYLKICVNIGIENIRVSTDMILADISINFGDSEETLFNCEYPKRFFDDCLEEGDENFNILPYNIRYDSMMRRLQKAEINEEGTVLVDVKTHIGRIVCYWRWMNAPPEEGYALPSYYAGILSDYLDDAERYLNHLYTFQEGVIVG
jgi:hypothetical protein